MKFTIYILMLVICGCAKKEQNSLQVEKKNIGQIMVMVGSDEFGFEDTEEMVPLSQTAGIGLGGEEYGGTLKLTVNSTTSYLDYGSTAKIYNTEISEVSIRGDVTTSIYLVIILQVFESWPDTFDGVTLIKKKFDPGAIDYTTDISDLVDEGFKVLNEKK